MFTRGRALCKNVKAMFGEPFLCGTVLSGPAWLEPPLLREQGSFETSRDGSDLSRDAGFNSRSYGFTMCLPHHLPYIKHSNGD